MKITGFLFYLLLIFNCFSQSFIAQCSVSSSCGYNASINITPVSIVPGSTVCPYGYNYNIIFSYSIIVTGVNSCYDANIGFQPQIMCSSQNNGYYTINIAAPATGSSASSSASTGTLITTTNPYTSNTDCNTATPTSLNCSDLQVTVFGPGISTTTYPCTIGVLPIELLSFKTSFEKGLVIISWSTASEKNNDFFLVERSADGTAWQQVSRVGGAGTSSQLHQYQAEDRAFTEGINYYRLKQTDRDGSFKYMAITFINAINNSNPINYYPNPFTDILTVETGNNAPKELIITNGLGQSVISQKIEKNAGIRVSALPQGIYILKIKESEKESTFKVIKN